MGSGEDKQRRRGAGRGEGRGTSAGLVLASASPRRRRLMRWLGAPFEVRAFDTPEEMTGELAEDPPALAAHLAAEKAWAARATGERDALVTAFDTIVELEGRLLGKPVDLAEARRMLAELSGREHLVHTGVALLCPQDERPRTFAVTTPVTMRRLTEEDVQAWIAEGELLGCAGAYNIESHLASVAAGQCFQNVAGLPLCHLYAALVEESPCGPEGLVSPVAACERARGVRCPLGRRLAGTGETDRPG